MVKTHIKEHGGTKYALFEVPLPNKSPVFMSAQRTPYMNEKRGVVIVDSEKFLELWRNEPHSIHHTISHGDGQTWLKDRKYSQAAEGFDYGCDNPVPLARVSCEADTKTIVSHRFLFFGKKVSKEQFNYVTFTNGVTRTIWLLTQGCEAFPVECGMPGARVLHRIAGASETNILTVDELIS